MPSTRWSDHPARRQDQVPVNTSQVPCAPVSNFPFLPPLSAQTYASPKIGIYGCGCEAFLSVFTAHACSRRRSITAVLALKGAEAESYLSRCSSPRALSRHDDWFVDGPKPLLFRRVKLRWMYSS